MTGVPRRVLVLSGSIGRGHDSVAEACAVALEGAGHEVTVVDSMALLGTVGASLGKAAFRRLLAMPAFYDGFHFAHLRADGRLGRLVERLSSRRLAERAGALVADRRPDLAITVFAGGAGALGSVRADLPPGASTVVFCTDATAHRLWTHPGIDVYLVCSDLAAATVHEYEPDRPLAVLPPPVRAAFYGVPDSGTARRALGLDSGRDGRDPSGPVVLLMAGGWGVAPLTAMASVLAGSGMRVVAVAGANRRLARRLGVLARRGLAVTPFGVTEEVHLLMAAADVVVTPAGQTCHEARVVGRPLVVLDVVPGHGRENAILELTKGGAVPCTADPASVLAAVRTALEAGRDRPRTGDRPSAWTPAAPDPWPVTSAAQWSELFLAAIGLREEIADAARLGRRGQGPSG